MTADIQSKRRLGLTATLVREDRREDDVFSLIGPKRYDAPWRDLEAQGWIAPAVCTEVRVGVPEYLRFEYATAEGQDRYRVAATNPAKMSALRALVERHTSDRVLVIGQYLDQLDDVAAALSAPLITGKTPTAEREKLYAGFREGSIRLLVVSKVANFSIDLPEANVAIQISGTFGSRQEEAQRLGRILRPKADGGQASFYTLVSRETQDQEFALHRQLFLAEQGYRYSIVDAAQVIGGEPLPPPPPQGEYVPPGQPDGSPPVVRPPGYVPAAPLPEVLPDNVIPFRASRGR
jgi:DNA excision repair protein ERCC-3